MTFTEKILAEFDEKFHNIHDIESWGYEECHFPHKNGIDCNCCKEVKQFLTSALERQAEEYEKKIEIIHKHLDEAEDELRGMEAIMPSEEEIYNALLKIYHQGTCPSLGRLKAFTKEIVKLQKRKLLEERRESEPNRCSARRKIAELQNQLKEIAATRTLR